jgi:hypothetical protein
MQITKRAAGALPQDFGVPASQRWRLGVRLKNLLMPNSRGAFVGAAIGAGIAVGVGVIGVTVADIMDEMCLFQSKRSIAQVPPRSDRSEVVNEGR